MQTIEHDFLKYDQYFITPDYKSADPDIFFDTLKNILKSGVKLIQFRSKSLSQPEYTSIAKKIFFICKQYNAMFIINDYLNYDNNKYCDGVQLTSSNLKIFDLNKMNKNLLLIGSCHNKTEVSICNRSLVNIILVSPVYDSGTKSGIGWNKFMNLKDFSIKPVYALGGLNYKKDIKIAKKYGASGIAGTSYFYSLFAPC